MAAHLLVSVPLKIHPNRPKSTRLLSHGVSNRKPIQCVISENIKNNNVINRRFAEYKPCIWDAEYLQSIKNDYVGETYERRAEKLKADVKSMMKNMVNSLDQLQLIHVLQRLGVAYHFEKEISKILENIYSCENKNWEGKDLHKTALGFRLLRQHGYDVPQDVFKRFLGKDGSFDERHRGDVKGLLSLYEASFYSVDNEQIMEEAWSFTSNNLKELMKTPKILKEQNIDMELVSHALDIPMHWRMTRLEARWYIDVYEREFGMNPIVLEFAKIDFNLVQAIHQQELSDISRYWKNLGLGERLSFARDRVVEAYLWALGTTFSPQDGYCRKVTTLAVATVTLIDDIYDVYGTVDELVIFNRAVERWDLNVLEELPDYMKIAFLAFFNIVNDMAYDILRDQNLNVLPNIKKAWLGLLIKYLKEAKWYHSGYKASLEEYMENGWVSIAGPLMDILAYISATNPIQMEALEFLESGPEIMRYANMICRLCNDFGTSPDELKRGDVPKAIQCYMHDTGVSEEVSREHMRELVRQTWKKANKYRVAKSPVSKSIIEMILNITRTSHIMYQYGDGHGIQEGVTENIELSLLVEPIPM